MPSFWDRINPIGKNSWVSPIANKSFRKGAMNFLTGSPEVRENVSTLRPEQEGLYNQAVNAGMKPGAGGAFGEAADYYRNNLSNDSATMAQLSAPEMRNFNENIFPGIQEQFAGMGAGGLSSSGFQNAAISAGTDLSERLGAIRANLRNQSAQGLTNIGQIGLGKYSENMVTQPGSEGLLSAVAPAVGTAIGTAVGGPVGGAIGNVGGNIFKNSFGGNKVGVNSSPYGGGGMPASPQIGKGNGFSLPGRSF